MNLIIPMAGRGTRLRPHTLTTPKPLIPIAGKPIVQRLVEDIGNMLDEPMENIGFVIGDFGQEVEDQLLKIAQTAGAKGHIFYQEEALGTAHAVHCAESILTGPSIVAFADTLFRASFKLDAAGDGTIWVKQIADPSAFGVVTVRDGIIDGFVEKPKEPVSDLAIIGIYYFKDGDRLKAQLNHIIEQDLRSGGEYQLTLALEHLKLEGVKFTPGTVDDWLDCGNKEVTVQSNSRYLDFIGENRIADSASVEGCVIHAPVFIGEQSRIKDSIIGPHVSIGAFSDINCCVIKESLIQNNVCLNNVNLINSMVGNSVKMEANPADVNLGDFTEWKG